MINKKKLPTNYLFPSFKVCSILCRQESHFALHQQLRPLKELEGKKSERKYNKIH